MDLTTGAAAVASRMALHPEMDGAQGSTNGEMPVAHSNAGWQGLRSCRLCWRITLVVFGLILAVEALILVPSAMRFQQTELERLAQMARSTVEPVLFLGQGSANRGLLTRELAPLVGMYGIEAIALYAADGSPVTRVGALPAPVVSAHAASRIQPSTPFVLEASDVSLTMAWQSAAPGSPLVVVRVDTSQLRREVASYLLRIGGLVALIVLVVTGGTMLVLYRWVLRAVLLLRNSALAAGATPERAGDHRVRLERRDELGSLIDAHNVMLDRVASSMRRDREMAEERARYLTHHDPFTRLPNRAALLEHVDEVARQRADAVGKVSLLLIEVTEFSSLNAVYGGQFGDAVLAHVGERLRRTAGGAFVAHLGNERYALVDETLGCDVADISQFAEGLLRKVGGAVRTADDDMVSLALRIGIARADGAAIAGRTLLDQAELALSGAALADGVSYYFYSPEFAASARERQLLAHDLKRAIDAGELYPVFQPKMTLTPGGGARITGAEVLVRWRHPRRGMIAPDQFIPLAESTGQIVAIGDLVLRASIRALRSLLDQYGWAPPLAVNLSAQQFADPQLAAGIARLLADEQIPEGLLELEITETAAMKDAARTSATLEALRKIGVRVAMDDFGTGYSSLSYLRRFALDSIKIDKSFVDDIGQDTNAEAICDAILRLGQSLHTKIVAEGVETSAQLEFLRARRCDQVQGYYFGKPVPLDEFRRDWVAMPRPS